jgi:hypothetical protein
MPQRVEVDLGANVTQSHSFRAAVKIGDTREALSHACSGRPRARPTGASGRLPTLPPHNRPERRSPGGVRGLCARGRDEPARDDVVSEPQDRM